MRPGSSLSAGSACLERLAVTGHDPIGCSQNPLAARLERGLVLGQRVHPRRAIVCHRAFVLARPTGFNRADAINIRIPIEVVMDDRIIAAGP